MYDHVKHYGSVFTELWSTSGLDLQYSVHHCELQKDVKMQYLVVYGRAGTSHLAIPQATAQNGGENYDCWVRRSYIGVKGRITSLDRPPNIVQPNIRGADVRTLNVSPPASPIPLSSQSKFSTLAEEFIERTRHWLIDELKF